MKFMKSFVGLYILALLLVYPASAAAFQRDSSDLTVRVVAELKVKIPEWLKERDVPGAAVAVVDDKGIVWQEVYGNTEREGGEPVTPATLFSIQSMSKSFTALGVLMAVQDGLLDLDTPINVYLPDFSVNSIYEEHPEKKITLRHLLSHRAGFTHEAPLGGNFDDRPHSFEEHILSISDTWLRYPVGYRYSYSNLGIDLAGYILQKKADVPFWDYVKEKVLEPIGMSSSTLDVEEIQKRRNRAVGHDNPQRDIQVGIPVFIPMIPAGGVYTNILDMAEYLRFHINKGAVNGKRLLKQELMEEMHAAALPEKHQRAGYGLGLVKTLISTTYCLQHGGGGYGFITSMCMYPELKIGVVTLSNSNESRLSGGRIQGIINAFIESDMGKTKPFPAQPTVDISQPLPDEDERVQRIRGFYDTDIRVGPKDGVLGITIGRDFYPLKFFEDGEDVVGTFGNYSELRIKAPLRNHRGSLAHLNRYYGTVSYYDFRRPEKDQDGPGPDKPEWKKYLGRYRTLAWGRTHAQYISISLRNGYLTQNGTRCREHMPGLFFTYNGEALDFRGTIPTFRNIMLIRRQ